MYKDGACVFPFFREEGIFWRSSREDLPEKKKEKGVFLNQSPEIPEKLRGKRGGGGSRENGIGSLLHCISVVGPLKGSGKTRTHIFRAQTLRKEKKGNRGHHNVPEVGGQLGNVP